MIIEYLKLKFLLEALEEIHLPYYKGSAFRGGFGNIFKKIVCVLKREDCGECILKSKCIYAYIFETYPQASSQIMNMNRYERIPHPFVIEPPEINSQENNLKTHKPGSRFEFQLILIGKAIDYLPYFIYTFCELGKIGLGKGRGRYKVLRVVKLKKDKKNWLDDACVYSHENETVKQLPHDKIMISEEFNPVGKEMAVTLHFTTPLRIKFQRDLVVNPEFHIIIRNLLRRLLFLYYFHCEEKVPRWNHKDIIRHAESVVIKSSNLKWFDWERYSSRQNTRMKLGGLVGSITYFGMIEPFIPFLNAGEILHLGKNTSFGLGKYHLSFQ